MKYISKLLYIIALGISIFSFKPEKSLNVVNVTEFGAIPDDGQNDATQLREAVNYCKSSLGTKLYFPPGIYNFKDEKAMELMNGILNGSVKGNPSDSIFRPYYPYVKGLNFDGTRNVLALYLMFPRN